MGGFKTPITTKETTNRHVSQKRPAFQRC